MSGGSQSFTFVAGLNDATAVVILGIMLIRLRDRSKRG
jgi:hypothetical protein